MAMCQVKTLHFLGFTPSSDVQHYPRLDFVDNQLLIDCTVRIFWVLD